MFIYSMRAKTLKFFGLICLCLVVVIVGITFVPSYVKASAEPVGEINYSKIKTEEDRIAFLKQFGWTTASEVPTEQESFTVPGEFDRVMLGYNEIQKSQGLDLARYQNKKITRYTYEITNYEGYEGKVYANILMYRDKVIAGDVCSADPMSGGFVHGFEKPESHS